MKLILSPFTFKNIITRKSEITHMACILFLLGGAPLGTQKKGRLRKWSCSNPGEAELGRNCVLAVMAGFSMGSGGSKMGPVWYHLTKHIVLRMALCISGQENYGWQVPCKSAICPNDITASLLPSCDLVTLQNSHFYFVSCCHIP